MKESEIYNLIIDVLGVPQTEWRKEKYDKLTSLLLNKLENTVEFPPLATFKRFFYDSYGQLQYSTDECLERLYGAVKNYKASTFNIDVAVRCQERLHTNKGYEARIICHDRNDVLPYVALVKDKEGAEWISPVAKDGQLFFTMTDTLGNYLVTDL